MNKVLKTALINSLSTALYIIGVAAFMYYGATVKIGQSNEFLVPVAMLLLFVSSAAITGFLIFGKPAILYFDGKKKEALQLITYTLISLSVITVIVLASLLMFNHR